MKDIQQLIKKNSQEGRYEDIFPKTFIDAVEDRESGNNLTEILSGFNMYFLSYNGSRELTRLQVPLSLRKTGLWITYVLYDKTVVTEWYAGEAIDDNSWKNLSNWRVGSNMLVGDISISSDGYWVVNGVVTTTKAQGEQGITPMLRVGSNNHLQVSYTNGSSWVDVSSNPVYTQFRVLNNKLQQSTDLGNTYTYISEELAYKFQESGNKLQMSKDLGNTWEDVSDYIAAWFKFTGTTGSSQADNVGKIQISRDNGTSWTDLSGEFTNSLYIKGYVATVDALPSTAVQGDIYGVGPTYDPSDTGQTNPIYQLYVKDSTGWVNNGKFTSIAAGVVQTTGTSTTEVMSQDAVTRELTDLELGVIYDVSAHNDGAVFESLSSLLGSANLSTLIPISVRHGGMSIRFVQSSDNKYVQYRLMSNSFNITAANWQGVDDKPTAGSDNLVKSGGVSKYRVENSKLLLYTNKYLNGETGQATYIGYSDWSCSEFVELDKILGNVISLNKYTSTNASSPKAASFVAYDENYNPVYICNKVGQNIYYKDNIPSTAKYIAFSFYKKTDVIIDNYSVWDSLHEISDKISVLPKPISNFGISLFWVDGNIWKNRDASYSAIMLPVVAGTTIKFTANANINTRIAFLNTYDPSNIIAGSTIDGEGNQNTLPNNTSIYIVPATCTYIALMNTYGGIDCFPISLIIDGVEYMKDMSEIVLDNMGRSINNASEIYQLKTNLEVIPQLSIVVGTIYLGNVITISDCLCATEYINVKGIKLISIIRATDIKVRITEYNSRKEYIKQSGYSFIDSFDIDPETNYIRISASYALRGYGESNPITTDAFTEGDFGITYIGVNTDTTQTAIIDRNINKDAAVMAVGKKAVNTDILPLSFIHISDIHTKDDNYKCFENACKFYEHYSNIKFMLATGDLVWDTYHDPTTWYDKALASTSKPILNVIGNHDAGQYNATYGLDSQSSDLECYNKFIAPYVNAGTLPNGVAVPGWGVIQPTNASSEGKSYYYKDFTDEKIRLIVLCEFETDYEINQEGTGLVYSREYRAMRQAQVTWLIDTLSSTPSDYGVIASYHQPDNLADDNNEFVSFNLVGSYRSSHGQEANIANVYCADKDWLPKILNAFATKSSLTLTVTQTGAVVTSSPTLVCDCDFTSVQAEFICILNGHTHQDYIGYLTNFPALKVLCVGADNLLYTSSFQPREEGTPSEDLFNVVNIDRNRKTIKIIRIGSNASVTGQVRDQMIMSYATT